MYWYRLFTCTLLATGLAGCATQLATSSTLGSTLVQTAQVTSVRDISISGDQISMVGTIVGSILGGLIGSHIGGGNGRAVASIGAAIAGGVAGRRIERSSGTRTVSQLTLLLDNGDQRTYNVEPAGEAFRVGDRVQVTTSNGISKITH